MRDFIVNKLHFSLRNPARFVLGLGVLAFIAAPAPDIDHPIAWLLGLDSELPPSKLGGILRLFEHA